MTRYIILLIAIFLSFEVTAQYQYIPLPLSNAQSRYRITIKEYGTVKYMDYLCIFGPDTIISGNVYKKTAYRYHEAFGDSTFIFPEQPLIAEYEHQSAPMREVNKKVYFYADGTDVLYYDFTLGIGDTLPGRYDIYGNGSHVSIFYIIQSIDTVNMFNALRKRFRGAYPQNPYDTITVIEGVGTDHGLIMHTPPPRVTIGGGSLTNTFYCTTAPGINYSPFNGPCYYIWPKGTPTSVSNAPDKKALSIYPNPFSDAVNIDSKEDVNVILYNAMGAVVSKQSITTGRNAVNTSALSNGVYFMVLKDESGTIIHKEKLIK